MDVAAVVARVRDHLERRGDELHAPGVQVALTDGERTLAVLCHGLANVDARTPVDETHRFEIGSIGKGFTAMALLREREAGRLDLDAPVTDYLPWLEIASPYPPITIHHLLSHTSGLVEGMDFTNEAAYEVWALREFEPGFAPGEGFWYSNVGYKALGLVLERITGRPWFETVHEHVMVPAGMADAAPVITHAVRPALATGYAPRFDDRPWQPSHGLVPAIWHESATADGTICATADELAGYVRLLLARGRGVVSEESFALMSSPIAGEDDDPEEVYGYGLRWIGGRMLGHSGSMIGYAAHASCDPATGFGVAICTNGFGPRNGLARFALDALAASAAGEPLPEAEPLEDPATVGDGERFAGRFRGPAGEIVVSAGDDILWLARDGERVRLLPFGDGPTTSFLVEDPELDRFPMRFEMREGGGVRWVDHGPDRFAPAGSDRPPEPAGVGRWRSIVGHYRSHDPWASNIRVFVRAGEPWLQDLAADDPDHHERPLEPLPDGTFRVGDRRAPDRIRFDTEIDGRATRAVFDCAPMYRTFTP